MERDKMNEKNWREWACIIMIFGSIQFLILTTLAMIFYAGGTAVNKNAQGYSFWSNFLSDTGMFKAWSGRDNAISYILFTITLPILGVVVIPFYLAFQHIFNESSREKKLSKIGSLFGVIFGIFLIPIALTPLDIYPLEHYFFNLIAFGALLVSVIIYTVVILSRKSYPHLYSYIYLTFAVIFGIYYVILFSILFGGPNPSTAEGLTIQATAQKVFIYASQTWSLIQSYGAWKQLTS